MRVLVCGGREFGFVPRNIPPYTDEWNAAWLVARRQRKLLEDTLDAAGAISVLIHGCSAGADELAGEWAFRRGIPIDEYPADWFPHGRAAGMDRSAGPKRNSRMLAEGKPDRVIAFPGGKGTRDMTAKAQAAGIEVVKSTPEQP